MSARARGRSRGRSRGSGTGSDDSHRYPGEGHQSSKGSGAGPGDPQRYPSEGHQSSKGSGAGPGDPHRYPGEGHQSSKGSGAGPGDPHRYPGEGHQSSKGSGAGPSDPHRYPGEGHQRSKGSRAGPGDPQRYPGEGHQSSKGSGARSGDPHRYPGEGHQRSKGSGAGPSDPRRYPGEGHQRSKGSGSGSSDPHRYPMEGHWQRQPQPPRHGTRQQSGRDKHAGEEVLQRPEATAPVKEMSKLSVKTSDARRKGRKRTDLIYPELKTRPKHIIETKGNSGTPVALSTNYFSFDCDDDWSLYQYHVDFNPMVDSKNVRAGLLFNHAELLGPTRVFDGMMLYLPHRLPLEVTEVFSQTKSNENIRITIKLTNEFPSTSPQCIHLYNVLFKRALGLIHMHQIGRNYYNMELAVDIPKHKLRVVPGFVTSILQYEKGAMLCADISHKIIRIDTVLDMLYDMYNQPVRGGDSFYENSMKKFVGSIVLTRYNNKTYRVDDIDWDKHPTDTFSGRDGDITFKDYYKKAYDIDILDKDQPMLVSKSKPKEVKGGRPPIILLVPELCILTGLSEDARQDRTVMKDVSAHTRISPAGRCQTLSGFIDQINKTHEIRESLEGWRMSFSDKMVQLNGRVVQPETIHMFGNQKFNYKQEDADWVKELRGKQLLTSVGLINWVICYTQRDSSAAFDLIHALTTVGPPVGMEVAEPKKCQLADDRSSTFVNNMKMCVSPDVQLVMCILPSKRKDRYDAIKKACCVDHPVPNQCVVSTTVRNKAKLMSIATKIAIQLNCKLGGEVWRVDIPLRNLMVIGIDTYHDSLRKGRSVGGVVCSINNTITRFYSRCTFQHTAQELHDGLKICVRDALKKYHAENRVLPERIVIYRDGVGDGQLQAVHEHEVPQVLESIKECTGDNFNSVKIAVVIVKKRINTRFFAKTGPTYMNPVPGTVVDTEVTRPEWYDFFLVSQSVRQGTVSPTHYNVIFDTTGLKPDHMQRLAYKMTHLYYNWPGTIRVPAPCQYAHKLAFLVGQSIHKEPSYALADRLYFL